MTLAVNHIKEITPRLLSVAQAASFLGIAPKTLRNRIGPRAKHPFPVRPKKIGRRVLFDRRDLDNFVNSLPHE
jgi:predicted DNA-binding transcriptional regulator AlpA